jgi:site-specific DNA-cytosine methylase
MTSTTFDTLMHAKKLQEKGFTAEQVEAQVEMIKEIIDTQLATKQDTAEIIRDLKELEYRLTIKMGVFSIGIISALAAIIKLQ